MSLFLFDSSRRWSAIGGRRDRRARTQKSRGGKTKKRRMKYVFSDNEKMKRMNESITFVTSEFNIGIGGAAERYFEEKRLNFLFKRMEEKP